MKLNQIQEPGFYIQPTDTQRHVIFEVIKNDNEEWLEECPEKTLLVDTWVYDHTDENDRKIYECDGLLTWVQSEDAIDVIKLADKNKFKVIGAMGATLIEDKPTYKEILQNLVEQMKNDIDMYSTGIHDNTDFIITIKDYLRMAGEEC